MTPTHCRETEIEELLSRAEMFRARETETGLPSREA